MLSIGGLTLHPAVNVAGPISTCRLQPMMPVQLPEGCRCPCALEAWRVRITCLASDQQLMIPVKGPEAHGLLYVWIYVWRCAGESIGHSKLIVDGRRQDSIERILHQLYCEELV